MLAALFFGIAAVYASVGQAGASGYLAAMALAGVSAAVMKPTALVLNVLVATVATVQFARSGHFSWGTFWPFALPAVPFAFVGGAVQLPERVFGPLVGLILVGSAALLLAPRRARETAGTGEAPLASALDGRVPLAAALVSGAGIGLLSGLTATGGAIFLSPLLIATGWGDLRRAAGVSAAFILVNSLAGLTGNLASVRALPSDIGLYAVAAGAGGLLGATAGSRFLKAAVLRRVLAAILFVAGVRLAAGPFLG